MVKLLGLLLFLLYKNYFTSNVHAYLFADSRIYDIAEIESVLNKEFGNICDYFDDFKLRTHFGEDKTTCILFGRVKTYRCLP